MKTEDSTIVENGESNIELCSTVLVYYEIKSMVNQPTFAILQVLPRISKKLQLSKAKSGLVCKEHENKYIQIIKLFIYIKSCCGLIFKLIIKV